MAEPINRGGTWWHEQPDGSWLRWEQSRSEWQPSTLPPPPEAPGDIRTPPPPPALDPKEVAAAGPFRPLDRDASWATRFLRIAVVLSLLAVISGFMELSLIDRLEGGELTGAEAEDAIESNDDRQGAIGGFQFLAYVLVAVFFLKWLSRAYKNLRVLGAERLRFTDGWAIGAWFVPILNFMRPKAIVNDIWRASDPGLPARQGQMWEGRPVAGIINWWWAMWLLEGVAAIVASVDAETADELRTATSAQIVGSTATAIAGVLLIYVIRAITARQRERLSLMSGTAGTAPTPW